MLSLSNSKIIFVSGWGGKGGADDSAVQESCWKLTSFIYNLGQRKRKAHLNGLLYITNKSSSPVKVSDENVRELQEMLWKMHVDEDGITRVIIAHSHGAMIAYESLKKEKLDSFLERKGLRDKDLRNTKMEQIRRHLAVFTLGGIQDIPEEFARVLRNLALPDDAISKAGKALFRATSTKNEIMAATEIVSNVMAVSNYAALAASAGMASLAVSASASASSGRHYIDDYIDSTETMNEILVAIGMEPVQD